MSKIANNQQCQYVRRRVIAQEGRTAFAPFTAQDSAAFSVFVHGMDLWTRGAGAERAAAVKIMRAAIDVMQPGVRYLCKLIIPVVGEFWHVEELWPQVEVRS